MKTTRTMLTCAALLAGALAAGSAFAWGHSHARVGVGFYFGVPYAAYPYYYPPYPYYYPAYSYYPPPVVVQQQAPVYVEQSAPAAQSQPSGYWYYCASSRAYYPYVKDCPGGWQRVAPQPQ